MKGRSHIKSIPSKTYFDAVRIFFRNLLGDPEFVDVLRAAGSWTRLTR